MNNKKNKFFLAGNFLFIASLFFILFLANHSALGYTSPYNQYPGLKYLNEQCGAGAPCESALYCNVDLGICTEYNSKIGDNCSSDRDCGSGGYCDPNALYKCVPRGGDYDQCVSRPCAAGYECKSGGVYSPEYDMTFNTPVCVWLVGSELIPLECGEAAQTFSSSTSSWPQTNNAYFCAHGNLVNGTPVFPGTGRSTSWQCGSPANEPRRLPITCTASREGSSTSINGACGTRRTTYASSVTVWPSGSTYCSAGSNPSAAGGSNTALTSPAFPGIGKTAFWTCSGSNGGTNANCNATRNSSSCTVTCATGPGCRTSLTNGATTAGECCGNGSCYQCDTANGYNWINGACVKSPSNKVTISGRVYDKNNVGIKDATISFCNKNGTTKTGNDGTYSKEVDKNIGYCARITSGVPAGSTIKAVRMGENCSALSSSATYEAQRSSANVFQSCNFLNDERGWDLNSDTGLDFKVTSSKSDCQCGLSNENYRGLWVSSLNNTSEPGRIYSSSISGWPIGSNYCKTGSPSVSPLFPSPGASVGWNCSSSTCNTVACKATRNTPSKVTISGKVTRSDNGNGIANAFIELCHATAQTNAYGSYSVDVDLNTYYCSRVDGVPTADLGYTSIAATNNNHCISSRSTYEWQVAGQDAFKNCSSSDIGLHDRNTDSNVDFVVNYPPPPPKTYTLTVNKIGDGAGTVTSNPSGIDCGGTCNAPYDLGSNVTLKEKHLEGNTFDGWGGDCSGTNTETSVLMDKARTCTAKFSLNCPSVTCDACKGETCTPPSYPGCPAPKPVDGERDCDWKEVAP